MIPSLLKAIGKALWHIEPAQRVSMHHINQWLRTHRLPFGANAFRQGARDIENFGRSSTTLSEIESNVLTLVTQVANRSITELTENTLLGKDLGITDMSRLTASIEATIGVPSDRTAMTTARTVGDLLNSLTWRIAAIDRAVPQYFSSSFQLPDFLRGLKSLPLPCTIDDAVFMLRHVEGVNIVHVQQILQQCRKLRLPRVRAAGGDKLRGFKDDELLSIMLYTAASKHVFQKLNDALRSANYKSTFYFLPYMRMLLSSLRKYGAADPQRCQVRSVLFRGVGIPADELVPPHQQDETVVYWTFSSTSLANEIPRQGAFVDASRGTYFQIQDAAGVDVSELAVYVDALCHYLFCHCVSNVFQHDVCARCTCKHSFKRYDEKEVLLLPGAHFRIVDVYKPSPDPSNQYRRITMKQVAPKDAVTQSRSKGTQILSADALPKESAPSQQFLEQHLKHKEQAALLGMSPVVKSSTPFSLTVSWKRSLRTLLPIVSSAELFTPATICSVAVVISRTVGLTKMYSTTRIIDIKQSEITICGGDASARPWLETRDMVFLPGAKCKVQFQFSLVNKSWSQEDTETCPRGSKGGNKVLDSSSTQIFSYPCTVHLKQTVPALVTTDFSVSLLPTHRIAVKFTMPASGGSPITKGRLVVLIHHAIDKSETVSFSPKWIDFPLPDPVQPGDKHSFEADLPEVWESQECIFAIALRNNNGWSFSLHQRTLAVSGSGRWWMSLPRLLIPPRRLVIELHDNDLQALKTSMEGGVFSKNIVVMMKGLGITPLHSPFPNGVTVLDFAKSRKLKTARILQGSFVDNGTLKVK
eukprot:INCI16351.13.p1 GENE.INCI16351.13~~INCI16351.13.p1  ORF type:complete len:813 (-),score=110.90 INCI16351.13:3724-6162(-)